MKKSLLVVLALVGVLGVGAMAGPQVGVGLGWYGNESWIAPAVGSRLVTDFGIGFNVAIGELNFVSGEDWQTVAGTFCTLTMTKDLPSTSQLQWYGIAGVGTPALIGANVDGFVFTGWEVGFVGGLGARWPQGWGIEGLVYINGDAVGVGVTCYYDFFVAARYVKP